MGRNSKAKGNRGNKKHDLIARNVVIIPPPEVCEQMVSLSKTLAAQQQQFPVVQFALGMGNIPHLSLYQTSYPTREEANMLLRVKQIAARTAPFVVKMTQFGTLLGAEAPDWCTFVFWDAESPQAHDLHQTLLDELAPFRHAELLPVHQSMMGDLTVPDDYKDSLRLYGTMLAGKTERLHTTLTRLSSPESVPAVLEYLNSQRPLKPVRFEVKELWVTDVGKHGTCNTILDRFPLEGST